MDYSSLTRPILPGELRQYRQLPEVKARRRTNIFVLCSIIGAVLFFDILIGIGITTGEVSLADSMRSILFIVFFSCVGLALGVYFFVWDYLKRDVRDFRLREFAERNRLRFLSNHDDPTLPGMIFSLGYGRKLLNWFRSEDGRFAVGNYQYETGSGKSHQTHNWGYLAIPLKRNVPNMVLDAKGNNVGIFGLQLSNLPVTFSKDQTLSLEGDFNDHFTLYAPKEYERDALYIFTPDFMAQLIDQTARYDVELVDNTMFIYSSSTFDLLQQSTWERLMKIVETVGEEAADQTHQYVDERAPSSASNIVAMPGRRLKQGAPIIVVVVVVVWFVLQLLELFLN